MLPRGTIPERLKLWFDLNVAFKSMAMQGAAEQKKTDAGPVTDRHQALRLVERAKRQVTEMEREAETKRSA